MNRKVLKDVEYLVERNRESKTLDYFLLDGNDKKLLFVSISQEEIKKFGLPEKTTLQDIWGKILESPNIPSPLDEVFFVESYTDYQGNSSKDLFFDFDSCKAFADMIEKEWFGDRYDYDYDVWSYKINLKTGEKTKF